MLSTTKVSARCALMASCAILLVAHPVHAQESAETATADAQDGGIEDIVVTAQRREERLQDVPLSVNAASALQLQQRGITELNPNTLTAAVPALTGSVNSGRAAYFLRGVGNFTLTVNNEQSVALYVDGVFMAAPEANNFEFNNIERIEVLKGPQGTLFGRNATGGVIQVITRDPGLDRPTANGSLSYGNYETVKATVYGSSPIGDNAAIDLALLYKSRSNGPGFNQFLGQDTGDYDQVNARSKLVFEPSDLTRIHVSVDYGRSRTSQGEFRRRVGTAGIPVPNPGKRDYFNNSKPYVRTKNYGGSLHVVQDLNFASLSSLTAYRKLDSFATRDLDGGNLNVVTTFLPAEQRTLQQELQLTSAAGSRLDWQIGLFLYDNKSAVAPAAIVGSIAGAAGAVNSAGFQHTKSSSVYAQATYEIVPQLKLTGGLRYTSERATIRGGRSFGVGAPLVPTLGGKIGFDKPTWRVALDYRFTDDVHAYASYNRGIKTGGFNILNPSIGQAFNPELLDAYEVGLKSKFLDNKVRLNLAGFYYNYKDIQVQQSAGPTILLVNAAAAEIYGLDVDFEIAPTRNLRIDGGFVLLHSEYKDFSGAVAYGPAGGPPTVFNAKGNRLPFASPFNATLGVTYTIPSQAGDFSVGVNASYNDGFGYGPTMQPGLSVNQNSYTLVNARLAWRSIDDKFGLELWGKNIFDEYYLAQGLNNSYGDVMVFADPATYGITASVKF